MEKFLSKKFPSTFVDNNVRFFSAGRLTATQALATEVLRHQQRLLLAELCQPLDPPARGNSADDVAGLKKLSVEVVLWSHFLD